MATAPTTTEKAAPAKSAAKKPAVAKADVFSFEAFPFEVPAAFQQMAETNIKTSKEAYDKMKTAAEETSSMLEDTMDKSKAGFADISTTAFEAAKSNTEAAVDMFSKLMGVKSVSEAVELQTSFASKQFETVSAQMKEMQEKSTKLFEETTAPYKAAAEKAFSEFKAA